MRNFSFGLISYALVVATLACSQSNEEVPAGQDSPKPSEVEAFLDSPPSLDELASATFIGVQDSPVELVDGKWEGEPFVEGGASVPAVGLVQEFALHGDVTGDDHEETVVLLWTSSGGSGTFEYLAVAGRTGDALTNLGTAELGDRVQVRRGRIANGKIELDVVQAGPGDAACCPTQMATRTWEMDADGLKEVSSEITGTLSVTDLQGAEWVLSDFAWNEPAPADPEVSLVFEGDKISGSAGCNGYFGNLVEGGDMSSSLSLGPLGATRKMCPENIMAVEDRFLKQLGAVTSFSYLAGKLALSWQHDDSAGVMLFVAREPSS